MPVRKLSFCSSEFDFDLEGHAYAYLTIHVGNTFFEHSGDTEVEILPMCMVEFVLLSGQGLISNLVFKYPTIVIVYLTIFRVC